MQYAHIAAVNSAARSQRAVELSAYDLAGDEGGWEEFESSIPGAKRKKTASGYSYKYPKGGGGRGKPVGGSKKGGKKGIAADRPAVEASPAGKKVGTTSPEESRQKATATKRRLDPLPHNELTWTGPAATASASDWAEAIVAGLSHGITINEHGASYPADDSNAITAHSEDKLAVSRLVEALGLPSEIRRKPLHEVAQKIGEKLSPFLAEVRQRIALEKGSRRPGDYGLGNPVDVALTKAMQKRNMDTDQLNALIKGVRRLGRFL